MEKSAIEHRIQNPGERILKHRVSVSREGKEVGHVEMYYIDSPIPHYDIADIHVEKEYRRQGIATQLLEHTEQFLRKERIPGVLVNIIKADGPQDLYALRGWVEAPTSPGLYVFNLPSTMNIDVFVKKINEL